MEVFSSTQALTDTQRWVSQVRFGIYHKETCMLISYYRSLAYLEIESLLEANAWVVALVERKLVPLRRVTYSREFSQHDANGCRRSSLLS